MDRVYKFAKGLVRTAIFFVIGAVVFALVSGIAGNVLGGWGVLGVTLIIWFGIVIPIAIRVDRALGRIP